MRPIPYILGFVAVIIASLYAQYGPSVLPGEDWALLAESVLIGVVGLVVVFLADQYL